MNDERIISEDLWLDTPTGGARALLRRKRLRGESRRTPLLMVHGATYASTMVFDYAIEGRSWMDVLARAGFDVWCIDLPGYGSAERPPEMTEPPSKNLPFMRTADAQACVESAIERVLSHCAVPKLHLLGYSWGTAICGAVAGRLPEAVERLVLLGALWLKDVPSAIAGTEPPGAYRTVTADAALKRWLTGLDTEQIKLIGTPAERLAWASATVMTDPSTGAGPDAFLCAPAGVVADVMEFWAAGRPTYSPEAVRAPTLIVVGEWDHETTPEQGREVFRRLEGAETKRYVLVGGATHSMPLERMRTVLYATVLAFLDEGSPSPLES